MSALGGATVNEHTARARRWDWHVTIVDERWNAAMWGAA